MYPNPVTNLVNFKTFESIENTTIFNMLGQQLSRDENRTDVQPNISSLAPGVYLAKAKTSNGNQTLQLIKE